MEHGFALFHKDAPPAEEENNGQNDFEGRHVLEQYEHSWIATLKRNHRAIVAPQMPLGRVLFAGRWRWPTGGRGSFLGDF